jgi:8-oxo-dGTP pyrophosphatase MutT (NUDIX family)
VTCFLESRGQILVLRRSWRVGTYKGKWGVVAGYIEEGETPEQAARKEILEETGIADAELVRAGCPYEFLDEGVGVLWVIHPFRFRVKSREVKIDWEHDEAMWVDPAELERMDTVPHLAESWRRVSGEKQATGE